jgi:hypothetical protein
VPFERDFGTSAEKRGEHAADAKRGRLKPLPEGHPDLIKASDTQADTDVDEIPPDET